MSTVHERDRLIDAFLAGGLVELPEWVYGAVRTEIDRLPQRRPWRDAAGRVAAAAAAVVVLAVIGPSLLRAPSDPPGPGTATPIPSIAGRFIPAGDVARGRHTVSLEGVTVSFGVLADGWVSDGKARLEHMTGGGGLTFWASTPDGVFPDRCEPTRRPVEPAIDTLAVAAATIPGTNLVSGPSDVVVRGHAAKLVVVTLPSDATCPGPQGSFLWYDDALGGSWLAGPGDTIRAWIIDVEGVPIWIDGETTARAQPIVAQDIQQVIDSIRFE